MPRHRWNLARDLGGATRRVHRPCEIAPGNPADDVEGEAHECENEENDDHRAKGQGRGGVVGDRHEIEEGADYKKGAEEHEVGQQQSPNLTCWHDNQRLSSAYTGACISYLDEEVGQQQRPNPVLSLHFGIHAAGNIAIDT